MRFQRSSQEVHDHEHEDDYHGDTYGLHGEEEEDTLHEQQKMETKSSNNLLLVLSGPVVLWVISRLVGSIAIAFLSIMVMLAVALVVRTLPPLDANMFMASGTTPAATCARELILNRKGGSGSSYFGDPSVGFGALSNFSFKEGKEIDFATLLEEKWGCIGPFCVDDERRQIVFVETEEGFDPSEVGPFYFQSQRDHAIKLYVVPYAEYLEVISNLPASLTRTNNVLLVYNTARCGSTLLSQCLAQCMGMQSISEPDIMTGLTHIASEAASSRDEELTELARASVQLLCYLRRKVHPKRDDICIKFRFQMVYIADLVKRAVPDSKAIFLYRDGLDVIDSMGAAFINTGAYKAIRAIGLDSLFIYSISSLPYHIWKFMPLIKDTKRFPLQCYRWLGAVSPFVFSWLSVMTYAEEAYKFKLIDAIIRYEDMIVGEVDYVATMLRACGWKVADADCSAATSVFDKDSHGLTSTRSRRSVMDSTSGETVRKAYVYLQEHEVEHVEDVIARHGSIDHPGYIIPGTLRA